MLLAAAATRCDRDDDPREDAIVISLRENTHRQAWMRSRDSTKKREGDGATQRDKEKKREGPEEEGGGAGRRGGGSDLGGGGHMGGIGERDGMWAKEKK